MFDWKEFFPVQAVAPFIGGLLAWFGLNYVYLSPSVIAPRLAQAYYIPACTASTSLLQGGYQSRLREMDEAFEKKLAGLRQEMAEKINGATGAALGGLFGNSAQGQRLARQGQELIGNSMAGNYIRIAIEQQITKARLEYDGEKQRVKSEFQAKQKFSDRESYCACNVRDGLSNRMDASLYTASLRIYKPETISRLEQGGQISEACGTPPLES